MTRSKAVRATLLVAAVLTASTTLVVPPALATTTTHLLSGTVTDASGVADDDAFLIVEQQLPAGARDAVFDDVDGNWYRVEAEYTETDGTVPGHYSLPLAPGTYRITAIDDLGAGATQVSEAIVPVGSSDVVLNPRLGDALDCVSRPSVQGGARVGQPITAVAGAFTPPSSLSTVTYQWYRKDPSDPNDASAYTRIDGARGVSYTPTSADVGRQLEVDVSGVGPHGNVTCDSTDSGAVFPAPIQYPGPNPAHFAIGGNRPVGRARVGATVGAPSLVGLPATSTVTYQWYRKHPGAQPIHGARRSTYRVHRADKGLRLYVVMTISDPSYLVRNIGSSPVRVR